MRGAKTRLSAYRGLNFSDPFGLCPWCHADEIVADIGRRTAPLPGLVSAAWAAIQIFSPFDEVGYGVALIGSLRRADKVADAVSAVRPRNAGLAGSVHPVTKIPFDAGGFPDFSGVATKSVDITLTGNRAADFRAANTAAGLDRTPAGYTWHHHQNGRTMQLVPTDVHRKTGHTGGHSLRGRNQEEE